VLRKTLESMDEEVRGGCRKLQCMELTYLYAPPNVILEMGEACGTCGGVEKLWWGSLKGRGWTEAVGVDGRIILKCVLNRIQGNRPN
jgi:hypothetical protein